MVGGGTAESVWLGGRPFPACVPARSGRLPVDLIAPGRAGARSGHPTHWHQRSSTTIIEHMFTAADVETDELSDDEPWLGPPTFDPPPSMNDTAPSGLFALELDFATTDPGLLTDADLVDAVIGFERRPPGPPPTRTRYSPSSTPRRGRLHPPPRTHHLPATRHARRLRPRPRHGLPQPPLPTTRHHLRTRSRRGTAEQRRHRRTQPAHSACATTTSQKRPAGKSSCITTTARWNGPPRPDTATGADHTTTDPPGHTPRHQPPNPRATHPSEQQEPRREISGGAVRTGVGARPPEGPRTGRPGPRPAS